jgi:hypothetical protein
MFRAAYRSSLGLQTVFEAVVQAGWKLREFPPSPDNGRSPHGYINQRLQIQFGARDDGRYAARNMLSFQ